MTILKLQIKKNSHNFTYLFDIQSQFPYYCFTILGVVVKQSKLEPVNRPTNQPTKPLLTIFKKIQTFQKKKIATEKFT